MVEVIDDRGQHAAATPVDAEQQRAAPRGCATAEQVQLWVDAADAHRRQRDDAAGQPERAAPARTPARGAAASTPRSDAADAGSAARTAAESRGEYSRERSVVHSIASSSTAAPRSKDQRTVAGIAAAPTGPLGTLLTPARASSQGITLATTAPTPMKKLCIE